MFLTDLYTTMTRARTASIFIDNGLSDIIGKNVFSDNKSQAPSILAGVKELREKKLAILDKFQLDLEEIKTPKEEKEKEEPEPIKNPDEDFIDPNAKKIDEEVKKTVSQEAATDSEKFDRRQDFSLDGEQVVETFTDITITGAEVLEH